MPKFLYTVIIFSVLFWVLGIRQIIYHKPDSFTNIFGFLFFLFWALSGTLSIIFYWIFYLKAPQYSTLKNLYRRGVKYSLFFASGVVALLALKAFGLWTLLNLVLFIILYMAVYMQLRSRR